MPPQPPSASSSSSSPSSSLHRDTYRRAHFRDLTLRPALMGTMFATPSIRGKRSTLPSGNIGLQPAEQ